MTPLSCCSSSALQLHLRKLFRVAICLSCPPKAVANEMLLQRFDDPAFSRKHIGLVLPHSHSTRSFSQDILSVEGEPFHEGHSQSAVPESAHLPWMASKRLVGSAYPAWRRRSWEKRHWAVVQRFLGHSQRPLPRTGLVLEGGVCACCCCLLLHV